MMEYNKNFGSVAKWNARNRAEQRKRAKNYLGSGKGKEDYSNLFDGWQQDLHLSKSSFVRESVDLLSPLQPP